MTTPPAAAAAPRPTAIVLAGGHSTRLAPDKAIEVVGGRPLLLRVVDALQDLTGDIVLVEAAGAARPLPELDGVVCRVADAAPDMGPLAGLQAGLAAAHSDHAWVVGCDMPFLHLGLLARLMQIAPGCDAVVPVWRGRVQPLCAVYGRACIPHIQAQLATGDRSLRGLLARCAVRHVTEAEVRAAGAGSAAFLNVNTPAALRRARRLADNAGAVPMTSARTR
jgi:molybdopterin-guanine dinucleotide biosynthesis protein A